MIPNIGKEKLGIGRDKIATPSINMVSLQHKEHEKRTGPWPRLECRYPQCQYTKEQPSLPPVIQDSNIKIVGKELGIGHEQMSLPPVSVRF